MKNIILLLLTLTVFCTEANAQQLKLSYPFPEKEIERFLVLPEHLDTLATDHFLLYQFKIKSGKAENIDLLTMYPKPLPEDYQEFALEKLKSIEFQNVVYNPDMTWYGTSLMLKLKPKQFVRWDEIPMTYDDRLDYIVRLTARLAGLKADQFNYIKPKYPEMLLQIVVGKDKQITVIDLYEDPETNKDELYWQVFNEITDEIRKLRFPPGTAEGDEFNIRLDFYKKLEWKAE